MGTIGDLILGPHTARETKTLNEAANRFQDRVIDKIRGDGTTIRFISEKELPENWPLGASASNYIDENGKNTIYFLHDKFNRGRAIHELFHAWDWKKTVVDGRATWRSDSEADPAARALHENYKRNFQHDFLRSVIVNTLKSIPIAPGAWYPVALQIMDAMHYPFLAGEAQQVFHRDEKAKDEPLVYYLARYGGGALDVHGLEPADGARLMRAYRDYEQGTFEFPEWKKIAVESARQASSFKLDESAPDRRFSEYAYLNGVREYTAEGAKFFMDTPETRTRLGRSDPGLLRYMESLHIARI